jgi:hypothetical protein
MRRWKKRIVDQFLDDVDGIKWAGALELMHERTWEGTNDVTIYFGAVIAVFNKTD